MVEGGLIKSAKFSILFSLSNASHRTTSGSSAQNSERLNMKRNGHEFEISSSTLSRQNEPTFIFVLVADKNWARHRFDFSS